MAAMTGQLPILDVNGLPTGQFDALDVDQRLKAIDGLVDKAMPDRQEAPLLPEDTGAGMVMDVRNLSDEELETLANEPALKLATTSSPPSSGPADSSAPGNEAAGSEPGTVTAEADPLHVNVHQRVPAGLGAPGGSGSPGSVHGSCGPEAVPAPHDLPASPDGQDPVSVPVSPGIHDGSPS